MYIRIDGQDIPVTSCKVKWAQNAPADVTVTIPAMHLDWRSVQFKDYEIWHKGSLFVSGFIFDSPSLQIGKDSVLLVTLGGVDEMGRLTCTRAVSDAHYQDSQITSIIQDLLSVTDDWMLGDTSTMVDALATTTIDLRSKEHLWAQIVAVIKSTPQLFLRYGRYNTTLGRHELDIGNFGAQTSRFVQGANIEDIQLQKSSQIPYTIVEGYGGKISSRKITLEDALAYPGINTHPDWTTYPIVLDAIRNVYVVEDQTVNKLGCEITKTFNSSKTRNDDLPSAAEIAEAGYALWQRCVRFLQQNTQYQVFTLTGYQSTPPNVNDHAWVQGNVVEAVYDTVNNEYQQVNTFSVADWYRITRAEVDFSAAIVETDPVSEQTAERESFRYSIEVSNSSYIDDLDDGVEVYERLEPTDSSDDVPALLGMLYQEIVTVTHLTTDASSAACLPATARQFVFNITPPVGATQVFYNILTNPQPGVTYTVSQTPALPGTPLLLCVQSGGTWPGASNVTLSVQFTYN